MSIDSPSSPAGTQRSWCLYLLRCRGGVYYAGITNDLDARFRAHVAGTGARFTRANPPQAILAVVPFPDRSSASKAEWALKQLPKAKKLAFMEGLARASEGLPEESPDGEEINEDLTQAQAPSI